MAAGAFAMVLQAHAQTAPSAYTPPPAGNPPPPNSPAYGQIVYPDYHAQEVSVDFFGAGTTGNENLIHYNGNGVSASDARFNGDRARRDARGGGGVGINYFFCRYVGVGADMLSENLNPFVYSASGNVIGRIPIGDTGLAPYVFAGGGYQWHYAHDGFGQAGAGLEYRFARHFGVFVDGRGVLPEHHDYGLFRAGLRVSF